MNWLSQWKWTWLALALCWPVLLVVGCATSGAGSHATRPGDGLREYRKLVSNLRKAIADCVQSTEDLASATVHTTTAQARFNESAQRLEVVSVSARARVEAMEKRGNAYFEEWAEELAGAGGEAARHAARVRFEQLRQHFDEVLKDSRQVRQRCRPLLDGLREARGRLGPERAPAALDECRPMLTRWVADGRQVQAALDQLLITLKAAETAIRSGPAPLPKTGGKP